jgi:(p)ppGpp synthase/HD superfamily hydrolase
MKEILDKITSFAAEAHKGQQRKYSPEAYITHPVRVMETCQAYTEDLSTLAAALLHDVLEDTAVSPDSLHNFLLTIMNRDEAAKTLQLVTELTDIYTKSAWPRMNRRSRKNREINRLSKSSDQAQTIKYADIIDNSKAISSQDPDFGVVYLRECAMMLKGLTNGNPELRQKAIQVVEDELQALEKLSDREGSTTH